MIEAFQQAKPVLEKIEQAGYEAYFVGGSVRDYLLQKENDDVDIATSATPSEIKGIFPKTIDVGIEHGTVLVLFRGQAYEITTFRSESDYEDYRRPKNVQFIRSLYDDLKRRDFTMNAIAMDKDGKLIDPFLGNEAINKKLIQTVGNPQERFTEDALRMMRAIRFVSQLSFSIEWDTFLELKRNGYLLKNISIERKTKEFEKLLCGKNRRRAIQLLLDASLQSFLPGLHTEYGGVKKLVEFECEDFHLTEMWAMLLYAINVPSKNCMSFLKEWRLPNQRIKEVEKMLSFLQIRFTTPWSELTLYHAGKDISVSTEKLYSVINRNKKVEDIDFLKERYDLLPIKHRSELDITGQDLMRWKGSMGGPWVKDLLEKIEEAVLLELVRNEKGAIKEWLNTCNLI